jgi:hypothetical protein
MSVCNLNSHPKGITQIDGVSEQRSEKSSVEYIPTASSFFAKNSFRPISRYHQCRYCILVLKFHAPICCITTSAETCLIMYCTCMYFHCTIHCKRASTV